MTRKAKPKPRRTPEQAELERFSPLLDAEPDSTTSEGVTVKSKLWRWKAEGKWHFVTVPKGPAAQLRKGADVRRKARGAKHGWGTVAVTITIGDTTWETSLFPHETGQYIFAVKASVRTAEGIEDGNMVTAHIVLR